MSEYEKLGAFYLGKEYDLASRKRQEGLLLYDSKDLTTHGVIIGMTGSGKTGLGIALLEEALIDKIPIIAIDPKGDLTNLVLTFPELEPADFEPWMDAGNARREKKSVQEMAKSTAEIWKNGLKDWRIIITELYFG